MSIRTTIELMERGAEQRRLEIVTRPEPSGIPRGPLVWPAKILAKVPFYSKFCGPYGIGLDTVCIYAWRAYWSQTDATVPAWMPEYHCPDNGQGDCGAPNVYDGHWTPRQAWWGTWRGTNVTGGWALNTAEFVYNMSFRDQNGPCCVPALAGPAGDALGPINTPLCQVTMFWGLFRDFNKCPDEPRLPYIVPLFHHHQTIPLYQDC